MVDGLSMAVWFTHSMHRLPCGSVGSVCSISKRHMREEEYEMEGGGSSGYTLSVATMQGILYKYWVADDGSASPTCFLEGEHYLTGRQL